MQSVLRDVQVRLADSGGELFGERVAAGFMLIPVWDPSWIYGCQVVSGSVPSSGRCCCCVVVGCGVSLGGVTCVVWVNT